MRSWLAAIVLSAASTLCAVGSGAEGATDSAAERCQKAQSAERIAACTEIIRQDKTAAWAYVNRALGWSRLGDLSKEMADLDTAIRLNPKYPLGFYFRGEAWEKRGELEKAIADYNQAIRLNPKEAEFYFSRGFAWRRIASFDRSIPNYDKAISDFNRAIQLKSNHKIARDHLRLALEEKASQLQSIQQTQHQQFPNRPNLQVQNNMSAVDFYNRANSWFDQGYLDRAVSDYYEAIKLNPDYGAARENLKIALDLRAKQQQASVQPQQSLPQPVAASVGGRRVALVIGNAKYRHAGLLENPVRDAELVAFTLRSTGFHSVTVKTDLTREGMIQALRDFARVADGAAWAMVYFSGHGIEFGGVNYMIPIDAQLLADRDIELETINIGQVLNTVEGATRLRLLVMDACRNNPFAGQMRRTMASRSLGRGLARIEPEAGTLVVYAAKHGEVALDGTGRNSPFAEAMAKRMQQKPALEIRRLFDFVRDDVIASTGRKQQPFSYGSLSASEDFFFVR